MNNPGNPAENSDKQQIMALAQNNRLVEAKALCLKLLEKDEGDVESWFLMGTINGGLGEYQEAESCCRKVISQRPELAAVHYNLGIALLQQQRIDEAIISIETAVKLQPDFVVALHDLANCYQMQLRLDDAISIYQKVISQQPGHAPAHSNLARALRSKGELKDAHQHYRTAIDLIPDFAEAHDGLGRTLWLMDCFEEAIEEYRAAIKANENFIAAYNNLGLALCQQDKVEEGMECYQNVLRKTKSDGTAIRLAMAMPIIPESREQIASFRERMSEEINKLLAQDLVVDDPFEEVGVTNFFLAYHGQNDRELQSKAAQLLLHACPSLGYIAPHCKSPLSNTVDDRIKVGFISRYLSNHSIGKTSKGLIELLSREEFSVTVFFLETPMDETSMFIQEHADQVIILPRSIKYAREKIAEEHLDVLFYQDIGMDSFTYFLAFSRLAPVQCTTFGHPDTTGIPNMDYFVSTENYETDEGEEHYSEKLFRLKNVASCAYYYRPEPPDNMKPRSFFGLDENENLYICPQALFKFHPDFDEILAGILRGDPQGRLLLIEAKHSNWVARLRDRFTKSMPDVMSRITFLPQQPPGQFLNLISVSDVMLDTIYFNGQNTTHEAFSAGVPVVTLPGKLMRSRHTLSFYKHMGFMDCVAKNKDEYIEIAVRIGTQSEYRKSIVTRLKEARELVWQEEQVVREFERFFTMAVRKAQA